MTILQHHCRSRPQLHPLLPARDSCIQLPRIICCTVRQQGGRKHSSQQQHPLLHLLTKQPYLEHCCPSLLLLPRGTGGCSCVKKLKWMGWIVVFFWQRSLACQCRLCDVCCRAAVEL